MRLPDGIRRLFRLGSLRRDVRGDLDDELDFHFEETVRHLIADGVPEEEALELTRARFGDERAYRNALERIDEGRVRMRERSELIDTAARSAAFAVRSLRRTPGFTVSVVAILALGIGANAVMFGVVDRLLLSPPQHVVDAERVRLLHVRRAIFNGEILTGRTVTFPDYRDFLGVGAFESVAAYAEPRETTVGHAPSAEQARVAAATASLFPLLGVQPALGRFFREEEDLIGADPTAVLAHEYWERERGGDPGVLGSSISVGQGTYTVVGVAPPGFTGAELMPVDIWLPAQVHQSIESGDTWHDNRGSYWLHTVARLAPGATEAGAAAEATAAHRGGRAEMMAEDRYDPDAEVVVAPIIAAQGPTPAAEAGVARWLAGVSAIVLLIACFNVANLLLAKAIEGRREIAVRIALGVGRARLTGDLVAESVLLSGLGAVAALLAARLLGPNLHRALLPEVAFTDAGLGGRLLAFTAAAALLAGLLTGVVPALQAVRSDLAETLRSGGRGLSGGGSRTRVALLLGQAALSVVLLVGAGLFLRSLRAAEQLDLGFDDDRIVVVSLEWNETLPGEERQAIYEEAVAGIRRLRDVRAAGLTYTVPFRTSIGLGQPRIPGRDSIPRHSSGGPYVNKVGAGYFEAMGLTILQGRGIEPRDDAVGAAPVAVVSESMARAVWPEGDGLGACMVLDSEAEDAPCTEVIGVVENHRRQELVEDDPHFLFYINQGHPDFVGPPRALMAGTTGPAGAVVASVREEARGVSPQVRFVDAVALSDYVAPQMRSWRLGASMFTAFGVLALIVAGWGLYSVLAFDVTLRRRELGIRSALGAGTERLVGLVLKRALVLVAVGVAVGVTASWGAAPLVQPLLFRVRAADPTVYGLVALTLLAVAALAGSVPAWRATRVDPREALQAD